MHRCGFLVMYEDSSSKSFIIKISKIWSVEKKLLENAKVRNCSAVPKTDTDVSSESEFVNTRVIDNDISYHEIVSYVNRKNKILNNKTAVLKECAIGAKETTSQPIETNDDTLGSYDKHVDVNMTAINRVNDEEKSENNSFTNGTVDFDDEDTILQQKKKKIFRTYNLYELYCLKCKKTLQKEAGKQMTRCADCNNLLVFTCKSCTRRYISFNSITFHLKSKCFKESNNLTSNLNEPDITDSVNKCDALKKNDGEPTKRFRRNKLFGTKKLYKLYCSTCEKTTEDLENAKLCCEECKNRLQYQCLNCKKLFKGFIGMYVHTCFKKTIRKSLKKITKSLKKEDPTSRPAEDKPVKTAIETENCQLHTESSEPCSKDTDESGESRTENLFRCHFCSFYCHHKSALKNHIDIEHKITELTRAQLASKDETPPSICRLEEAEKNFSKVGRPKKIKSFMQMYCATCEQVLKDPVSLKRCRCRSCHNNLAYRCRICSKHYYSANGIYAHLRYECSNRWPQFQCPNCNYRAKQKAHLELHMKRRHTPIACDGCGASFDCNAYLKKHQATFLCGYVPRFECEHCFYTSNSKTGLVAHIRRKHVYLF